MCTHPKMVRAQDKHRPLPSSGSTAYFHLVSSTHVHPCRYALVQTAWLSLRSPIGVWPRPNLHPPHSHRGGKCLHGVHPISKMFPSRIDSFPAGGRTISAPCRGFHHQQCMCQIAKALCISNSSTNIFGEMTVVDASPPKPECHSARALERGNVFSYPPARHLTGRVHRRFPSGHP